MSVRTSMQQADFIANQIVALAVERGEIAIAKIEEIFPVVTVLWTAALSSGR